MNAKISEIFFSTQGEGPYTGKKQIFIRFFGCSLGCDYCDTKFTEFYEYTKEQLVDHIRELLAKGSNAQECHSISITGGEPLEQIDFLKEFLPYLKAHVDKPIYLETNGLLYVNLKQIIDYIDIISMDIKILKNIDDIFNSHEQFLKIAYEKEVFCKLVLGQNTDIKELEKASKIISDVSRDILTVVQPVDDKEGKNTPTDEKLQYFKKTLEKNLKTVKIMQQMHKKWKIK